MLQDPSFVPQPQMLDGNDIADLYDTHIADSYDRDTFGLLAGGHRSAVAQLQRLVAGPGAFPPGGLIVDLALGTGGPLAALVDLLPGAEPVGIDISARMLEIARRKHPDIRTILDDAANIGAHFGPGSIDLALMHFLTTYIDTPRVIAQVADRLKPGGWFSVASTTYESFPFIHGAVSSVLPPALLQSLNPAPANGAALAALLEQAGLEVVALDRFEQEIHFASLPELVQWGMQSGFFTHILSKLPPELFRSFEGMASQFPVTDRYCSAILLARKPGGPA